VRILATLLRPDGGTTTVGGLDVVRHAAQVRRLIGLTGQYASVDEDLTGTENLVLIGRLLDLRGAEAKARAAVGRCAAWQRQPSTALELCLPRDGAAASRPTVPDRLRVL
jgi:ABC-type multidrug transport system ATPase subunit